MQRAPAGVPRLAASLAPYLWVALGTALGSVARYAASLWVARLAGEAFPWGTLAVNILGSVVIGWVAASPLAATPTGLFLAAGLCGGFTTFSAFSLQTFDLARRGWTVGALANIALSVVACLGAVWLGTRLA